MVESTNTESFLGPRMREGAFIGVSAVCLYLLLALITYSPADPGWSATGTGAKIANMGGSRCLNGGGRGMGGSTTLEQREISREEDKQGGRGQG